ncbi:MAG: hypothetical protein IKW98_13085 [Prevotella sp.]|nr:hypothetical protein [Prevotella sp.]
MRKTIFTIIGCVAIISFIIVCCEWTERDTLEVDVHNLITKKLKEKVDNKVQEDETTEPVSEDTSDFVTNNTLVERLTNAEALDGWIGSCPWVTWKSDRYRFRVQYPYFMNVVEYLTHDDCIYLQWEMLKMIGKMYENNMSVNEKYEALKSGANTSSVGEDYFLLAGRIGKDMRFFEKDIKGERYWYYLRVEFPVEYTKAIDPLLQYVKDYYPCDFIDFGYTLK